MKENAVDLERRRFLTGTVVVIGGIGAGIAAIPFVSTFQPSARAKAVGAPVEVDISKIEIGGANPSGSSAEPRNNSKR